MWHVPLRPLSNITSKVVAGWSSGQVQRERYVVAHPTNASSCIDDCPMRDWWHLMEHSLLYCTWTPLNPWLRVRCIMHGQDWNCKHKEWRCRGSSNRELCRGLYVRVRACLSRIGGCKYMTRGAISCSVDTVLVFMGIKRSDRRRRITNCAVETLEMAMIKKPLRLQTGGVGSVSYIHGSVPNPASTLDFPFRPCTPNANRQRGADAETGSR